MKMDANDYTPNPPESARIADAAARRHAAAGRPTIGAALSLDGFILCGGTIPEHWLTPQLDRGAVYVTLADGVLPGLAVWMGPRGAVRLDGPRPGRLEVILSRLPHADAEGQVVADG